MSISSTKYGSPIPTHSIAAVEGVHAQVTTDHEYKATALIQVALNRSARRFSCLAKRSSSAATETPSTAKLIATEPTDDVASQGIDDCMSCLIANIDATSASANPGRMMARMQASRNSGNVIVIIEGFR